MSNEDKLPDSTSYERSADAVAIAASAVPYIGGPIASIITGITQHRRRERIRIFLLKLADDLKKLEKKVNEHYIQSEDFEELLEDTFFQLSKERSEEKQALYRSFLLGTMTSPTPSYDEQKECLRLLEIVQFDHVRLLRALVAPPEQSNRITGSPGQTLLRRLSDFDQDHLNKLVSDVHRFGLASVNLNINMTASGAENLGHSVTDLGRRFLDFLVVEPDA